MNLLTMMTLAVLVPGAGADTENTDVWVRMTSKHVEVFTTPEEAEAVQQKGEEGIWVKCKSLKINFTAEGNVIECEGRCTFNWGEGKGTAHSIVFDQGKNTVKFKGKENTPVQWTYHSEKNGELKFVGEFEIEIQKIKRTLRKEDFEADKPYDGENYRLPDEKQLDPKVRDSIDPVRKTPVVPIDPV